MNTIKGRESGGNYQSEWKNGPGKVYSTASGAYGMLDRTWRNYRGSSTASRAKFATVAEQDAAARRMIDDVWRDSGGDVSQLPVMWYLGTGGWRQWKAGKMGDTAPDGGSISKYQRMWLADFKKAGGSETGGSLAPTLDAQGQVIGSATANSMFQEEAPDPEAEAERWFRQMHPEEAGAGDLSDQYEQFTGLLAGGTAGGIGGSIE